MQEAVSTQSALRQANLLLTSKEYQRAIDEYRIIEDKFDLDDNLRKLIKNRILHCKFMSKGIIDCRNDGLGIYYHDALITYKEAIEIIAEVKRKIPTIKSSSENSTDFDDKDLEELLELKEQYNNEGDRTNARKVRAMIRKLKS